MINGPETTIGIFLDGEKTNMISIAGLLAKINLGEAEFSKEDYFRTRDGLTLRKAKEIEKEFDEMLVAYRGGNLLINIIGDDPNQTTLEL